MKVTRYKIRDISQPSDPHLLAAVFENVDVVLGADHDARIAQLKAALKERDYALRAISQWDMLNPVRTDLIGDLGWLKTLVAPFASAPETPRVVHSKSEQKRLAAFGVESVVTPKETKGEQG